MTGSSPCRDRLFGEVTPEPREILRRHLLQRRGDSSRLEVPDIAVLTQRGFLRGRSPTPTIGTPWGTPHSTGSVVDRQYISRLTPEDMEHERTGTPTSATDLISDSGGAPTAASASTPSDDIDRIGAGEGDRVVPVVFSGGSHLARACYGSGRVGLVWDAIPPGRPDCSNSNHRRCCLQQRSGTNAVPLVPLL